ncbi:PEP-CTERM sorting domain-containing protein [Massilia sp. METH4]|uniref:PEP-CTERM sorting domain-containing protein n=1 Tax=Massilia sp. METH4 TaxID=3123041 RepID=UPI0030D1B847
MKNKIAAVLLCGPVFASAAHAAEPLAEPALIRYGSSLGNVRMHVYDLTPADGMAAGYTIGAVSNSVSFLYSAAGVRDSDWGTFDAPGTFALDGAHIHMGASWGGPGDFSVEAAAGPAGTTVEMYADGRQTVAIAIAPHTAFVFSGLSLLTGDGYGTRQGGSFQSSLALRIDPHDGASTISRFFSSSPAYPDFDMSIPFSIGFTNATDTVRNVTLSYRLSAYGYLSQPLPGVPEPSTWWMLASGLLAVGWRLRHIRHAPLRER